MKRREIYSSLTCIPPVFVRIDGRNFHVIADKWGLERPFDLRFSEMMTTVCERLISDSGLSPAFSYTFSDEISLYFPTLPFSGRIEKIDSVTASYAASALTLEAGSQIPVSFDARIIQVTPEVAVQYLIERQIEAWRNHINAWCQYALAEAGCSRTEAARQLKGLSSASLHELAFSHGINLAKTPVWQRRGVLVYRKGRTIEGWNPRLGRMVRSVRTTVECDRAPPLFSSPEGRLFLSRLFAEL
ncbi:MAG TPA: tRNA(His) guanylyltransferase Thg1 family protein [Methanoregulaceae archaeon]|nr:MAG: tRNA 5'-guanylyltransferase [Methanolinea sp.]HON81443.1 tRNA(His) guanylyltransferase Thg1 family protein [Methanoregulaceae archaeon]HRT15035.1 tRNA(His) guanylyltransferase Thg1 family protein [Methanoregulaceae archaeon]HRU30606.1 tRNA(His) guanylyltransferase Thg1 family protein [Methanoregulaceae archaeon]